MQFDNDEKDETIARPHKLHGNMTLWGSAGVMALVIGTSYVLYKTRPVPKVEREEAFETARSHVDLPKPSVGKTDGRLQLPEPAPPVVTPPVPQPAPVVVQQAPPVDDRTEARRREEEERLRKEYEAYEARLRSKILVVDDAGNRATNNDSASVNGSTSTVKVEAAEEDINKKFLASVSSTGVETSHAAKIDRIDALIPQGTMIRATLETAIQSDLAGMVRAITTEDIYSFDGRRILIPRGSTLTGEYKSGLARGQTRVFIVWSRLLRADGVSMALGSIGTDDLGRSGLTGEIDQHFVDRFGSSVMLSMVGGLSAFVAGLNKAGESTTSASTTSTSKLAQTQAQQVLSQSMTEMANMALKDSINIAPTIYVEQGTRIVVFVRRDLDFSALYADPVKEALRELRKAH